MTPLDYLLLAAAATAAAILLRTFQQHRQFARQQAWLPQPLGQERELLTEQRYVDRASGNGHHIGRP